MRSDRSSEYARKETCYLGGRNVRNVRNVMELRNAERPFLGIGRKETCQAILKTRPTAATTEFHLDSLRASCLRPAAVREYERARRPASVSLQAARIQPV